jgi:hypothetical protein
MLGAASLAVFFLSVPAKRGARCPAASGRRDVLILIVRRRFVFAPATAGAMARRTLERRGS